MNFQKKSLLQQASTENSNFACLVCKAVGQTDYCDDCLKAKKDIQNVNDCDEKKIFEDYHMQVTYEKNITSHCDKRSKTNTKMIKYFPIPSQLRIKNILKIGVNCSSDPSVSFFYNLDPCTQAYDWNIISVIPQLAVEHI
jgi:hypothetical protein